MKRKLLLSLGLIIGCNLFAIHKGKVYVDKNKNGIYDSGEQLLSGVMVTDGLNVVKTNKKGEFELPGHEKERFISVTNPSGYRPADKHYIPISAETKSYNFGVLPWNKVNKQGKHSFIQISDTEIRDLNPEHKLWAHNVRDYAQNEAASFIIHTGDICYEGGLKAHIQLMNSKNMGVPMYYGIGNHDLVKGDYGEQLFESIYGPAWYSFDYGNVHYIMTPMPGGDYWPSYKQADVYSWLKNDLALVEKNKPIVIFNHDLLSNNDEFVYKKSDTEKLVLNKEYNLKGWLYGHWHNHFVRMQGGVKTISTSTLDKGGIDHSTSAYRVVTADKKGDLETQLRYTYLDNHIKIASIGNECAPIDKNGNITLTVNTYSSTANTKKVEYKIYTDEVSIASNRPLKAMSDWAWTTQFKLPKKYAGQQIFVEATSYFNNGTVAKAIESFTYEPNKTFNLNPDKDWTNLLHNSSHVVPSAVSTVEFPINIAWTNNVKANLYMSSPIVYQGNVYVASLDEDLKGDGGIYALDGKTGDLKWRFKTRNSIKNTIAAEAGNIYAQDGEGYLYAVNAATGKLVWEKRLKFGHLPVVIEGVATNNGIVYAGVGKALGAYDAITGNELWVNTDWGQNQGATSTISVNDDVLLMGSQWSALYAHDAKTGKKLWQLNKFGISNRGSSPALYGNNAYFISNKSLFIVDALRGEILLKKDLPYSLDATSTPLVTDKLIVFGTVNKGLVALDKETFEEKWNVTTYPALVYTSPYTFFPANTIETSPILVDNMIVFGASDGNYYGVNKETGSILWLHETGAPIFGTCAVSGNVLYTTDYAGNVYAFSNLK